VSASPKKHTTAKANRTLTGQAKNGFSEDIRRARLFFFPLPRLPRDLDHFSFRNHYQVLDRHSQVDPPPPGADVHLMGHGAEKLTILKF